VEKRRKLPKQWKTIASKEDPPHKIDLATFKKILYWMNRKRFAGDFIVQFTGKDDVIQVMYVESTPQYRPVTSVDDIEEIIESLTEGEEE
jgi:hypothetical protein